MATASVHLLIVLYLFVASELQPGNLYAFDLMCVQEIGINGNFHQYPKTLKPGYVVNP